VSEVGNERGVRIENLEWIWTRVIMDHFEGGKEITVTPLQIHWYFMREGKRKRDSPAIPK